MQNDRQSLDELYTDLLRMYPPGEQRDRNVAWLLRVAAYTADRYESS